MIEKYSLYNFQIFEDLNGCGFYYEIYTDDKNYIFWQKTNILRESDEWFDTEQEARFAAIGHISTLEEGEEPDYDKEPQSIDWDERRKLGE